MQYIQKTVSVFVVILTLLTLMGTGAVAQAEETELEAGVSAESSVKVISPLQLIKGKRLELQQKARSELEASKKALQDSRMEMRPNLRNVSSGSQRTFAISHAYTSWRKCRTSKRGTPTLR